MIQIPVSKNLSSKDLNINFKTIKTFNGVFPLKYQQKFDSK